MQFCGEANEYVCHACVLAKIKRGKSFFFRIIRFKIKDDTFEDIRFIDFLKLFRGVNSREKERIIRHLCSVSLSR